MYYAIVEKKSGIMQSGVSNYVDNRDRPLPEDLVYVPLNDVLTALLTTDCSTLSAEELKPLDFTKTKFDFDKQEWVLIHLSNIIQVDPLEAAEQLKNNRLREVNIKLQIPDLSASAKTKLENYKTELENLIIDEQTAKDDSSWPKLPF